MMFLKDYLQYEKQKKGKQRSRKAKKQGKAESREAKKLEKQKAEKQAE